MATNKSSKKTEIKTMHQAKDAKDKAISEGKSGQQDLTSIAEVRMLMYVVPVAIILALFVYFVTR
jgi:hypothetical protein